MIEKFKKLLETISPVDQFEKSHKYYVNKLIEYWKDGNLIWTVPKEIEKLDDESRYKIYHDAFLKYCKWDYYEEYCWNLLIRNMLEYLYYSEHLKDPKEIADIFKKLGYIIPTNKIKQCLDLFYEIDYITDEELAWAKTPEEEAYWEREIRELEDQLSDVIHEIVDSLPISKSKLNNF